MQKFFVVDTVHLLHQNVGVIENMYLPTAIFDFLSLNVTCIFQTALMKNEILRRKPYCV